MQGGNVAGGLGLDKEFFESIMVPQVMLYGFLGFHPTADGFSINPRLPKDWPELAITRIHLHGAVLDIAVRDKMVTVTGTGPANVALVAELPEGWQLTCTPAGLVVAK
jgi:trehalose/maltose hydrolase-like predicted phosphorylase